MKTRGRALAAIVVAVAAVAVIVAMTLARSGVGPAFVAVGDRVHGLGSIIVGKDGVTRLCLSGPTYLSSASAWYCSSIAVELAGLDLATLPGRETINGVVVSRWVSVSGTWTGSAIQVSGIETRPLPDGSTPAAVPCPAPSAGWAAAPNALLDEAATRRLGDETSAHTALYSGYWSGAASAPDGSDVSVVVVGTTGDVAAARTTLAGLYPYALCTVQVPFSADRLFSVDVALMQAHRDWQVETDIAADRVVAHLTLLDQAAATELARYPEAVVDALVARD